MPHTIRQPNGRTATLKNYVSRKTAIRLYCCECLGWETNPKNCTATMCPLFPFRGRTRAGQRAAE